MGGFSRKYTFLIFLILILVSHVLAQNRFAIEQRASEGSGALDYYDDLENVYEDLEEGDEGEGSGVSLSNSVILRFYLYLSRDWESSFSDHMSTQYLEIANNATETIQNLYSGVPGAQFITLADIKRGTTPGLQSVTIDLLSQNNEDKLGLIQVLTSAISSGQLPLFSPIIDSDWWKEVKVGGIQLPDPLPQPPGCRADTQIVCPGTPHRICEVQRCDGVEDCPKNPGEEVSWDENQNCISDLDYLSTPTPELVTTTTTTTTTTIGTTTTTVGTTTTLLTTADTTTAELTTIPCSLPYYECESGECIPGDLKCDGNSDCPGGEDENLEECIIVCGPGEFTCVSDGSCIDRIRVCDRIPNCPDRSDEKGCPCDLTSEWTCGDGSCINLGLKCDGVNQCLDGSDESSCCKEDDVRCSNGSCVSSYLRCNGEKDCPAGEDEQGCQVACGADELTCRDGSCVKNEDICNDIWDCSQGEDEISCPPKPAKCGINETVCIAGGCGVPCDGRLDCDDGEDERECCRPQEFRCGSGECVPISRECDGKGDCQDGSDEHSECGSGSCISPNLSCGSGECIPPANICDGEIDCTDALDELNCTSSPGCRVGQFRCGDGRCVDGSLICDGNYDCIDAADERDCKLCSLNEWQCEGGDCIQSNQRCDGFKHCSDGSDELDCPGCNETEFSCNSGSPRCIDVGRRCDATRDCQDGSDELGCGCRTDEFTCNDLSCISGLKKCDGVKDCFSGEDETPAECGNCRLGQFKCLMNGECILEQQRCDGFIHCSDGSDERDCPMVRPGEINLRVYPTEQTIKEGREVVFQCRDEGTLRARVAWRRGNGLGLPYGTRDVNGRLEMPNIKMMDTGTYVCYALEYSAELSVYLRVEQAVIPTTRPPTSCQLYQATCNNGDCIDRSQVCNGVIDCADGSDESGCRASNECEPNEYQCENKKCVLKTWRCDGDDDCGDGTDEQNCQETDPSNPCRFYEWQCSSGDQCIPKSFHCDGEMDCQDQSDEIGCTGPVIVISPPPAVLVDQSYTFIINCTAMGIPTPEVVWRLNWGHVPEKCRMTNQVQEGNRAYGELTCTNAQKEDSGAYSCEAINSMGSCFAGSAGCGQPGQDAIVVVNAGNSVCPSGYFNNLAVTREDCLPCYCSELSDTCSSADLYFSKLPPPAGIFQLISRDPVTLSTVLIRRLTPEIKSVSSQRLYLLNKSMLEDKGVPYFSMPNSHTGNLLKSYGGYLKFSLSYAGEGNLINEPMIIIQGENNMLVYYPEPEPRPGVENRIEVRFWPGDWFTDYKNGNRASREDILRVLSNVKYLLLKAQQVDSGPIDTTISDISMDSADTRDSGAGSAVYIEQCVCPPGYTGLSCESCSPGYERSSSGTCRRPSETCPTGYYADPDTGECNVCPCPLTTPSNQFGRECRVDTDRQVTCVCATGYTGRRCGDCSPGYVGNPALPGGSCTPGPVCNYPDGSFDRSPNPTTGRCRCKAGYTGEDCNQAELSGCGDYKFLSREESVPGCINCFCMGVPTRSNRTTCQPSQLYRYKERAVFQEDHLGFSLTDRNLEYNINSSDLILSTERQEISYDRFDEDPETIYYWKLPHQFLGNKLTSYGGYLEFILRHIPTPGSEPTVGSPLIEIQGNDVVLIHDSAPILETNSGHKFKVRIHEKDWKRFDGGDTNREHLLMALANLDHILIRASHSPATREGGIADVSLECAVNRTTGGGRATAVEGCICPRGYKGLSCEDCAPGYTRSGSGVYLGTCEPCNCNGKSSTCDPENGICLACRDFTVGPSCESCIDGFFKDPRSGGCIPESGSISPCSCDPRGSLDLNCINNQYCQCKENVEGMNCDRCKPGTFNLDYGTPQGCRKCFCSGVTDECSDARLFWSTLRMNAYDKTYLIKDESQQIVKDRELRFDNRTMEISYQISPEESETVYYWELPRDVTGNRLGSYGGNLTIIQRYLSSGRNVLRDPAVIIVGGEVTLVYPESKLEREDGIEKKYKIPILESEWMVGMSRGRETPASREDMLSALSDVKAILVRASVAEQTVETYIRKTMLDIAVPQMTGGPLVQGAEECRCPVGYSGYSCESCALGYYRDWTDRSMGGQGRCVLCPCNNNEDSCSMVSTQEVECICKAGYSGQMCEYRGSTRPDVSGPGEEVPITITMNEPKIQIIEVGNTVRFSCNAIPRFRSQDPMTIAWAKENGLLPAGRASDNGQGLLVITSVRSEDSGTYICTATTGRFVKTETAVLSVEGGESTMAPIASIDPPYQQISVGDRLQMDCRTSGSPTPTVTWSRGRGEPLNPRVIVRGSSLFIGAVGREDEGEYICTASSTGGSTQSRTQIYVTSSGNQENKPQDSSRISVNPQDLAISVGDSAMFICEVSGGENYRISWERMEGRLPFTATESSGRLTISAVRVEDSGIYICQATSSSGAKLESQARLTITSYRGPPSVRIEPEEQTIGQGSSTELRCIGSGEPAPSLEWSKVGEDLSSPNLVVSGGVLSLRNAAVSDRGMYICTAENAGGSARASGIIEVERREPPGVEIYPENSQTITKSGSVLFQCRTIAGIPSPLVTWTRVDGLPLQPNVELLGGGVLRINRVTGKEQGGYKCRAQNEVGSTEAIATLVVQEVPTIILQPKGSVTMQVGTKLSISCSARGDPPPSVSWKKIGMTTRQVGTSSPVYEISRLTKEDEGTYACVARNIAGETEERVQIIVLEEDEFYSYPDQSGGQYPGQNGGRYPDQSGGRYPDQNGERYPDQNEGRYPDQNEGRYPDQSGGRYPDQNEGRYPDQSGGRYPDQNEGRYPDQSGEPGGLPLLDNQPVSVGANIRLECMTVGEGASFSGQWKRADGRRFPTRHYQSQGILNLVRVDADDEGVYVCEVVDNRGSVVYEVRKEIILISPPRITLDPQRQTVNPGDSPLITCSATGSEPINILWSREDGSNLPRSVSQSRGRLQFRGISVRDQGRYSCTASNPDGNSVATAEVIVNENSLEDPSDPGYKGYQPPRNPEKGYQPPSAPQPYKGYQPPRPNPMEDRSRGGASGAGLNQPYPDLDQGNTYPQPSYPDSLFYDTEEVDYYDYGRRPEPINPGYSAFPDSPDYERRSEPERLTASIGANIDLPCRLPENNLVTWRRDGGALPPTAQQITNTLRISKVLDQDSGRYICSSEQGGTYVVELRVEPGLECDRMEFECSNKAGCVPKSQLCDGEFDCTDGSDELSCGLYRIRRGIQSMRRNPVVTVEPSSPRIVEGGSLDISCKVAGVESGSVRFSWSKVGSPELPENTAARGNLIRFMNLVGENNGLYRCTAETELGIFYSDYSLFVQSKGQGTGYRPYP